MVEVTPVSMAAQQRDDFMTLFSSLPRLPAADTLFFSKQIFFSLHATRKVSPINSKITSEGKLPERSAQYLHEVYIASFSITWTRLTEGFSKKSLLETKDK